jgi:hypothetical protein
MTMDSRSTLFVCALVALTIVGCSHEGGGAGTLEKPAANPSSGSEAAGTVEFSWKSGADASRGTIAAASPDGRTFQGTFLQPSYVVRQEDYGPYWDAWSSMNWGVGAPWYAGSQDDFLTAYGGKALAHLTSADGTRMRCMFVLREPVSGMAGGGEGDCQLSTNERVFHAVLASK